MKTLKIIQTLSQMGRILSKIICVCCIIGVVGCVVGMVSLPFADTGIIKIGGMTVYGLIVNYAGIQLNSLYPLLTGAMIVCIGQAITAKFAENYFKHELATGTPFTVAGAKELLRLGIITVCVPLGALILSQISSGIMAAIIDCGENFKLDNGDSVVLGVMFIVMSLICKCGAELLTGQEEHCLQENKNEQI